MTFSIRQLQRTCWLGIGLMLALALAPGLSQLFAAEQGHRIFVELCTAQGLTKVAVTPSLAASPDDNDAPASQPDAGTGHCLMCSSAHVALATPPARITLTTVTVVRRAPRLFLLIPHTPHVWASVHARGPPIIT